MRPLDGDCESGDVKYEVKVHKQRADDLFHLHAALDELRPQFHKLIGRYLLTVTLQQLDVGFRHVPCVLLRLSPYIGDAIFGMHSAVLDVINLALVAKPAGCWQLSCTFKPLE